MADDQELLDSENETTDQTDDLENADVDTTDAEALKEKNKALYARAKKAEEELKALKKPKEEAPKPPPPQPKQPTDVDALVNERFEQRDLESLDLPEELKSEVSKLAKLQGISVRKAAQDSYILHRKGQIEQQRKVDDAAINRSNKGTTVKFDAGSPPQVDLSTEEGRKTWDDYKKFLATQ